MIKKTHLVLLVFLFVLNSIKAQKDHELYIFLLDDCPICIQFTDELNDLYDKFGGQFEFIGVFPNFSSKRKKIESFEEKYNIQFPLKTDYYKDISTRLGAEKMPQVFLVEKATDKVLYQGAISNAYYKPGRLRKGGIIPYLANALVDVTNQREVRVKKTEAIGCYINFQDSFSKEISNNK